MSGRRFKRRDGKVTVSEAAAHLEMPRAQLFAWLRHHGWLPQAGEGTTPTPVAVRNGYMDWDEHSFVHKTDNRPDRSITPLITRQGYGEIQSRMASCGVPS